MKLARIFAVIFGVAGLVLMLGTAALCFTSVDAPVKVSNMQYAEKCAEEMMDALAEGDFAAASERMYYRPDLGVDQPMTGVSSAVWELFRSGISYEFTSGCYADEGKLRMDARITVPQIPSMTDTLKAHARDLMNEKIAAATEMAQLYDENNEFRPELISEVLTQAMERTLAEEPETQTYETTLTLIWEGKSWWVVPDTALMQALSGGL